MREAARRGADHVHPRGVVREMEEPARDGDGQPPGRIGGVIGLIIGADLFVEGGVSLASALGLSQTVIGLTIIAIGTSLPEIIAVLASILHRRNDIALSNIIGSNITVPNIITTNVTSSNIVVSNNVSISKRLNVGSNFTASPNTTSGNILNIVPSIFTDNTTPAGGTVPFWATNFFANSTLSAQNSITTERVCSICISFHTVHEVSI